MSVCFSHDTINMYILMWFRFIIAKIYNILRYVIVRILLYVICAVCISKKQKYLKNKAREQKTER